MISIYSSRFLEHFLRLLGYNSLRITWVSRLQEQEAQVLSSQLTGLLCEPAVGEPLEQIEAESEEPQWVISHWQLMRTQLDRLRMIMHMSFDG